MGFLSIDLIFFPEFSEFNPLSTNIKKTFKKRGARVK